MRTALWAVALATGCSSSWRTSDAFPPTHPDAPSALVACAGGGAPVDGEVSAVLCTAPTDLLTGPVASEALVLEPGAMSLLAP